MRETERKNARNKRVSEAFRWKIKPLLRAWLYLWRRKRTVDSPPLSQLPLKPWLNHRVWFGRRSCYSPTDCLSETNTACLSALSVQLLAPSTQPTPPQRLTCPTTNQERSSLMEAVNQIMKASSPSEKRAQMSAGEGEKGAPLEQFQISCLFVGGQIEASNQHILQLDNVLQLGKRVWLCWNQRTDLFLGDLTRLAGSRDQDLCVLHLRGEEAAAQARE